jgi:hypothetical protein
MTVVPNGRAKGDWSDTWRDGGAVRKEDSRCAGFENLHWSRHNCSDVVMGRGRGCCEDEERRDDSNSINEVGRKGL